MLLLLFIGREAKRDTSVACLSKLVADNRDKVEAISGSNIRLQ